MHDGIHLLPGSQPGKARLVLIVLGADLHEGSKTAHANAHRLAAGRIYAEVARLGHFLAADGGFSMVDEVDERLPEFLQQRDPLLLAVGHRVERVLHLRGEVVVDIRRKVLGQEAADDLADVGRRKAPVFDVHVLAVTQRRYDRCIGRRTADAVFLQCFDQRRFGEARRRLREVLRGNHARELDAVAFLHGRQHMVGIVLHDVVQAFLINRHVAWLHQRRSVGAEHGAFRTVGPGQQFDCDRIEYCRCHLTGHGALPDQGVQPKLIRFQVLFDVVRQNVGGRRTNGLVRFLGILRLGLVDSRLVRQPLFAVELHDHVANMPDRFLGQVERIGAHVGDETNRAFADVDALV